VSLEKGSVLVPNYKYFLVTEAERKFVSRRARFQQHGDASCHQFFSCKARRQRKFTPFLQEYYRNMHHRMPPSKLVAQFKLGDFSIFDAPIPRRPKTVTIPEIVD